MELDGLSPVGEAGGPMVVTIAATNRPDLLDQALLRPGRFDRHVYVAPPTAEAREAILRIKLRKVPLADDADLPTIAARMAGFSGAEVAAVCREAALVALGQAVAEAEANGGGGAAGGGETLARGLAVGAADFDAALAVVKPSITVEQTAFYEGWAAGLR